MNGGNYHGEERTLTGQTSDLAICRQIRDMYPTTKTEHGMKELLPDDAIITMSECAGVLQYAQTCFEGMKAYTTEDGHIVTFRPDLNAATNG